MHFQGIGGDFKLEGVCGINSDIVILILLKQQSTAKQSVITMSSKEQGDFTFTRNFQETIGFVCA